MEKWVCFWRNDVAHIQGGFAQLSETPCKLSSRPFNCNPWFYKAVQLIFGCPRLHPTTAAGHIDLPVAGWVFQLAQGRHIQPMAQHSSQPGLASQHQPSIGAWWTPSGLKAGLRRAQCRASSSDGKLVYDFDTLAKHSPVSSKKTCSHAFLCDKGIWEQVSRLLKEGSIWQFISDSVFSQHKYITREFSNWISWVAVERLSCLFTGLLSKPPPTQEKSPCFIVTSYSCRRFLAVGTFVNNCFEGWSTERATFHQKSLANTLGNHSELQPPPLNQTDALVSQEPGHISHQCYGLGSSIKR